MEITDILNIDGWAVKDGAQASLLSLPSLKTPNSVDWGEEDGKQYDTIGLCFASKEITISYAKMINSEAVNEFETALRSSYLLSGVKAGDFQDWNSGTPQPLTLDLRVKSVTKSYNGELCTLTVVYSMDTPLQGTTLSVLPAAAYISEWTIDGKDFGFWGFTSLEGALTSYHTDSTTKEPQNYAVATMDGQIWDTGATPVRQESTHTLTMLFRQPIKKAWSLLNGFADILKSDGMRTITDPNGNGKGCIFESGKASAAIVQNGEVWVKFSLSFNS